MIPVSDQFLAALAAPQHKVCFAASVCDFAGNVLADLPVIGGGTVTVDTTTQVRRTASITVQSDGINDSWTPKAPSDLLWPENGNEVRISRGIEYADGSQELCPQGVFRVTAPAPQDTGDTITIPLTLNDRSSAITYAGWGGPYVIPASTNVATAIQTALETLMPGLTYSFAPSAYLVPATTFGGDPTTSDDPWSDLQGLATDAGCELFFDPVGVCVLQPVANPSQQPTVYTFAEATSSGPIQATRTLDETQAFKGVLVIGNGTGGAPVQASVGTAPYYVYSTTSFPWPGQSGDSSGAQAQAIAQALYAQVVRNYDEPSWTAVCNPAIVESDVVGVTRARLGYGGPYALTQIVVPLDYVTAATYTGRPPQTVDLSS